MRFQSWTVSDAKAHLSEILRRARTEGPQQIGERKPCILIPADEWKRLAIGKKSIGPWLVENLSGLGDMELPDRIDHRPIPFGE